MTNKEWTEWRELQGLIHGLQQWAVSENEKRLLVPVLEKVDQQVYTSDSEGYR